MQDIKLDILVVKRFQKLWLKLCLYLNVIRENGVYSSWLNWREKKVVLNYPLFVLRGQVSCSWHLSCQRIGSPWMFYFVAFARGLFQCRIREADKAFIHGLGPCKIRSAASEKASSTTAGRKWALRCSESVGISVQEKKSARTDAAVIHASKPFWCGH